MLYRCLDTASIVLADMQLTNVNTEELIRETLGSDTCDARRSVSDPPGGGKPETGPCAFDRGLKSKYPTYDFPGDNYHSPLHTCNVNLLKSYFALVLLARPMLVCDLTVSPVHQCADTHCASYRHCHPVRTGAIEALLAL